MSLNENSSSTDEVQMMSSEMVNLNTRSHSYEPPPEKKPDDVPSEKPSASTPPPNNGLVFKLTVSLDIIQTSSVEGEVSFKEL